MNIVMRKNPMTFDLRHVTSRDPLLTADLTVRVMMINVVHSLCNMTVLLVFTCHVSRSINVSPLLHSGLTALSNSVIPFHLTINSVFSIYHRCKNAYSALKLHLVPLDQV